jgi:abhydrolase domain-containing protein 12
MKFNMSDSYNQNAGSVAQGWRTDIYRSLSDGSTSNIHILAPDYRGFGLSTGFPSEEGLIIDGLATVNWALQVAKIRPQRIVIIGHSLGTAVTSAVVNIFAERGVEFAGVILISGFTDLTTLLTSYAIGGWVPLLAPLQRYPVVQKWFMSYVVDKWPSATRLANFVRVSQRVRLFIIHARNDYEIPYIHSEALFAAAANVTTDGGMDVGLFAKMKARGTVDMGDGAFVSTWKAGGDKIIREQIVAYGGK